MDESKNNSLEELGKIFSILRKHIKLIVSMAVITTIVSAIAVFFVIKPKYQSSAELIVNQRLSKSAQATELQQAQAADLQMVNTYKTILNSQTVGKAVKRSVGASLYNKSKLSVDTDSTSQVITINVTADKPNHASMVANQTALTFKQKIKKIMHINNVSIISRAQPNKEPSFPNKLLGIALGLLVGIFLGVFASLFKEYNAKTIDDTDYIVNELGLTELGTIDDINISNIKKQLKN